MREGYVRAHVSGLADFLPCARKNNAALPGLSMRNLSIAEANIIVNNNDAMTYLHTNLTDAQASVTISNNAVLADVQLREVAWMLCVFFAWN